MNSYFYSISYLLIPDHVDYEQIKRELVMIDLHLSDEENQ